MNEMAMTGEDEIRADDDALLRALIEEVPFDGWTRTALRRALVRLGRDPAEAGLLFEGGAPAMIEAWAALADREMEEAAGAIDESRLSARVRALILLRLDRAAPHREAIRRALAILALPRHAALAARITGRTVDAIWHAAGDRSADFSWYTKRAILAAVYSTTLLYWLRDGSEAGADTAAFLDRRLKGVALITRTRKRLESRLAGLRRGPMREDPSPSA
ncbi:COQ9 family protein [Acidiphilium sp. C61]|jgi:ubiquinone biosynthesis protein COQ9|uniref:COQ9 family protein n=1 Tax=Acidiphilium sp. C61 TaxID=1671485 RepID=UPI00157AF49E|nr:COQ9 family protein [Acidiphilium sp. C61]